MDGSSVEGRGARVHPRWSARPCASRYAIQSSPTKNAIRPSSAPLLFPTNPYTAATVLSGQIYAVKTSDIAIRLDTSGGTTATATLPAPSFIGETHTFFWVAWGGGQVAPTINTSASKTMPPYNGMASSAPGGLVSTTTITTPGGNSTLSLPDAGRQAAFDALP